jgi:hypothetical protein
MVPIGEKMTVGCSIYLYQKNDESRSLPNKRSSVRRFISAGGFCYGQAKAIAPFLFGQFRTWELRESARFLQPD